MRIPAAVLFAFLLTGCATPRQVVAPQPAQYFHVTGMESYVKKVEQEDGAFIYDVSCRGVVTNVFNEPAQMVCVYAILKDQTLQPIAVEKTFLASYLQPGESREYSIRRQVKLRSEAYVVSIKVQDGCAAF